MLKLTQKGVKREDAYRVVQSNAMKTWDKKEDFYTNLSKDKLIKKYLTRKNLISFLIFNTIPKMLTIFFQECLNHEQRKKIYEGKAKILYAGPERGTYIQYFKDDATAFNNLKKAVIDGKGVLNNRISEFLLTQLNEMGIETHLIKRVNMREQLIKAVEIIPIEFVVRNIAAGTLSKRLGIPEGTQLKKTYNVNITLKTILLEILS